MLFRLQALYRLLQEAMIETGTLRSFRWQLPREQGRGREAARLGRGQRRRLVLRPGTRHVCLDLTRLRHCDDALLTTLVRCQRMVRAAGGRLSVIASSVAVCHALVTIGLDRQRRSGPLSSAEVDW